MRATVAVWTVHGLGILLYAVGSSAVIALQPIAGQHAIVGVSMPLVCVLAALIAWTQGMSMTRAAILAVGATTVLFLAAIVQALLGEAWLWNNGGNQVAPVLFATATIAPVVGWATGTDWRAWVTATVVALGLYVTASFTWPFEDDRGLLLGSGLVGLTGLLLFVATGMVQWWLERRLGASAQ